jgi:hypothetical protein
LHENGAHLHSAWLAVRKTLVLVHITGACREVAG